MNPSLTETPVLSRRGVLKIGLCASAFLATAGLGASLSGCSSSTPASGFALLRSSDLPFLRAVIPVLLEGVASAQQIASGVEDTLKNSISACSTCRPRCSSSRSNCSTY